jgi:glutamine synthetase
MATKHLPAPEHPAVAAVRKSGTGKVKVACSDIDGVLRGKLLHIDKFLGAVDGSTVFPTRWRAST